MPMHDPNEGGACVAAELLHLVCDPVGDTRKRLFRAQHKADALRRRVDGISQKMLPQTLREPERTALITPDRWAEQNFPELDRARALYDLRQKR